MFTQATRILRDTGMKNTTGMYLLALLLLTSVTANGTVIYSSLGPGDSFSVGSASIGPGFGPAGVPNTSQGTLFTAGGSGVVSSIEVGVTGLMTFQFYASAAEFGAPVVGAPIGDPITVFESLTPNYQGQLLSGTPSSIISLAAGVDYWLVASAGTPQNWFFSSTGERALQAVSFSGPSGPFGYLENNAQSLRVNASTVPLPSTAWLFISVLGGWVVAKRKPPAPIG